MVLFVGLRTQLVVNNILIGLDVVFCRYMDLLKSLTVRFACVRFGSISCAPALPVFRGRHRMLVNNFSHESDVTSL